MSTQARPAAPHALSRRANRSRYEALIATLLFACAAITVATTGAVIFVLAEETFAFFREVSIVEFLTERRWTPLFADAHYGIAPLVLGTLLVTVLALVVGVPLGLGSAVFLSEYASPDRRRQIQPWLELLAGIPTVVFGYFALLTITPIVRAIIPGVNLFNPISAGLVMGFMILPTVSSVSLDAMQSVPRSLREAAYGLGASRFEVVTRVIVPAALSGIVASVLLAIARAVGETMIVTLAAGQRPTFTFDPRETIATMTAFIVQAATGDQPAGSLSSRALYAVGATLFVITLSVNLLAQAIVARFSEKYE
ncbi:MAG: phosphate ABC transporter permease subunit PstC [Trueperaceae bacterium]